MIFAIPVLFLFIFVYPTQFIVNKTDTGFAVIIYWYLGIGRGR